MGVALYRWGAMATHFHFQTNYGGMDLEYLSVLVPGQWVLAIVKFNIYS